MSAGDGSANFRLLSNQKRRSINNNLSLNNNKLLNNNKNKNDDNKKQLPEIVSQWYYKHGLFLSSYPTCSISIAIILFFISCYPLVNIPLPGTIPTKIVLPFNEGIYNLQHYEQQREQTLETESSFLKSATTNYSLFVKNIFFNLNSNNNSTILSSSNNPLTALPFPWAQEQPILYVQQIILRSGVHPWIQELETMDAYRSPLYEVFKLLEIVRNHESSSKNLDNLCLHVENVKRIQKEQIFPQYNCLVLSPANFWSQDVQNFSKDGNILNTMFQHHTFQKGKVSISEILIGVPIQDSGFKRYPLRSRPRIIQYAITLILRKYDKDYIESLKEKLQTQYPPLMRDNKKNEQLSNIENKEEYLKEANESIIYIYYPSQFKIAEFAPTCIAFTLLFLYIYFSVRKIDLIKSRLFLAIFAVFTVIGSLLMSLGLCFFFGLTISLQSKGIFQYLVVLVGLENCLVITKSVVSTDEKFDAKIRFAQALSQEGWHISKTLLTEITILTVGLATFVPVIQEFCVFAIVGLISDFILQMFFFSTGLAMNIKRVEYTAEVKNLPKIMSYDHKQREFKNFTGYSSTGTTFHRSHSFPKLSLQEMNSVDKKHINFNSSQESIPKRLRIVNFWARTRFFQRAFMIWMSIWIFSIVYESDILEKFLVIESNNTIPKNNDTNENNKVEKNNAEFFQSNYSNVDYKQNENFVKFKVADQNHNENTSEKYDGLEENIKRFQYPDYELSYYLSNFHWSAILKQYNVSLAGRYVSVLPSIKLSKIFTPEVATLLRNPKDQEIYKNFQWKALAAALDPLDFNQDDRQPILNRPMESGPLYPKSPMEIFIVALLCGISVFVLTYTMVVFYRCICTKNYAEWRSSWNENEFIQNVEQVLEGIPMNLSGHKHKIECLVSDGNIVISCCLKGQIKVWDIGTGECITQIIRNRNKLGFTCKFNAHNNSMENNHTNYDHLTYSPVWCMDYLDNLIALGCANGRIELWEIPTGELKYTYQEELREKQGVTHITLIGDRVICAKLCGRLDFYRLETYYKGKQIDWGFTSAYRRTHARSSSAGTSFIKLSNQTEYEKGRKEEMTCTLEEIKYAHQQPISCMEIVNGMIFTGSKDHNLRVFNLHDPSIEFTLHGHCGPITCLFVDKWQAGTGGSASQDGLLCVWDLFTGACMYNIQAHDGSISALVCAPSYVISLGVDERICVWERFQGNLLSTINISNAYTNLVMLTPSLLVTSKCGSLIVWDVRTGEPAREVKLVGDFQQQLCPKIMILANSSVICDYGNQIRIVKFPIVEDKCN